MELELSNKGVREKLGLTARTVNWYTSEKLVVPDIKKAGGRGTRPLYSFENLVDFCLIRHLVEFGLKINTIKRIMDKARKSGIRRWYSRIDGSRCYLVIIDAHTNKPIIYFQSHGDPKLFKEFMNRKTGREPFSFNTDFTKVKLDLETFESALVVNLSQIATDILKTG